MSKTYQIPIPPMADYIPSMLEGFAALMRENEDAQFATGPELATAILAEWILAHADINGGVSDDALFDAGVQS